jgi:hypothetical protein
MGVQTNYVYLPEIVQGVERWIVCKFLS